MDLATLAIIIVTFTFAGSIIYATKQIISE